MGEETTRDPRKKRAGFPYVLSLGHPASHVLVLVVRLLARFRNDASGPLASRLGFAASAPRAGAYITRQAIGESTRGVCVFPGSRGGVMQERADADRERREIDREGEPSDDRMETGAKLDRNRAEVGHCNSVCCVDFTPTIGSSHAFPMQS